MKFTKKDLIFSTLTGLMTGVIAWMVLMFLGVDSIPLSLSKCGSCPLGMVCPTVVCLAVPSIPMEWLVLIVPVLWIVGVNLGYFLGKWMPFFNQFGKFVAVGFTNFFVDAGILNLLIGSTGIESGWHYSVFKTISFIVAVTNSYVFNKYWVFGAGSSSGGRSELFKFLAVNVFAIVVNVGIASFVVNYLDPFGGLDAKTWANVGSVAGSAVAIMFTFVGARLIVFRKVE